MRCSCCHQFFNDINTLLKHLKQECLANTQPNLLVCGEEGCIRMFSEVRQFRRHMVKDHLPFVSSETTATVRYDTEMLEAFNASVPSPSVDTMADVEMEQADPPTFAPPCDDVHSLTCKFLISLYKSPTINRSAVQVFIENLQKFFLKVLPILENNSLNENENESADHTDCIRLFSKSVSSIFTSFQTEFLRFQQFEKSGNFIRPREVVVGYHTSQSNPGNKLKISSVPSTLQVVPLANVFERLFSIENVLVPVMDHLKYLKESKSFAESNGLSLAIDNIMQGSVWQTMMQSHQAKKDTIILPLIIYYDDFEIGNPLGGHAGVHRLGGLYVSIPALPPHLYSLLDFIFLVSLCHSSDKAEFGNKKIFAPAIQQLNALQEKGVYINTPIFTGHLKFQVVAMTGDNLGLNSVLGFNESFSANKCCRICKITKRELQTQVREDQTLLRTMSTYYQELDQCDPSGTGIKEKCCWLDLNNFSPFDNVATDGMHDHLEGVARYAMTFLINFFLSSGMIPRDMFLVRLQSFDYGPDSSSKPSNSFTFDGGRVKLKCSASEMMVLVRYFGLIFGPYIPPTDENWHLYILLRQIMDIILANRVYDYTADKIDSLVADFNTAYMNLTKTNLKPKHHFLCHYGRMMRKFGPLKHVWAMRFEGKHRPFKTAARATATRVNITKTLAIRQQLILNELLTSECVPDVIILGKRLKIERNFLQTIRLPASTTAHSFSSIAGVKWRHHSVVLVDFDHNDELPIFGTIQSILKVANNQVFFYCLMYNTITFNDHYQAHQVEKTDEFQLVDAKKMLTPCPNHLTVISGKIYITARSYLN